METQFLDEMVCKAIQFKSTLHTFNLQLNKALFYSNYIFSQVLLYDVISFQHIVISEKAKRRNKRVVITMDGNHTNFWTGFGFLQ